MKKVGLLIATAVMLVLFAFSASAEEEGYYTYKVENGEATITDVSTSISGKVTIPSELGGYSVTSIGKDAFRWCTSLTSITIPDSVTSIGDNAFEDCSSLTSITIPDSVTSIGSWAFYNTKYYNNESNWKDNILYIDNHLIDAKNSITSCDIREGTVTIASSAFYNCSSLTSITIPDSVTSIGKYAFRNCTSLASVTIGDGVTSIGSYAFEDCKSLTSITIPDSVTSIGYGAFEFCKSLTSITIPDGVTSIVDYAFRYCSSLTSITIPDSVTSIGDMAFYSCNSLTSVTIPDSVTSIGDDAFAGCSSLTSVTIPDSVKSIGDYAFEDCDSLTSVTIPDSVTSIGESAFEDCDNLTSVTIPDSVTIIGNSAFNSCISLTSVTIGDNVTSIGNRTFAYCESLTSVTIGDSVTSIDNSAFAYCESLTSIIVNTGNANYSSDSSGVLFNKNKSELICYPAGNTRDSYAIPDSVTSIGNKAFYSCNSLTSVTIPDSVTSIGSSAFEWCKSLTSIIVNTGNANYSSDSSGVLFNKNKSELICYPAGNTRDSYTIPDSVTSIGAEAFYNCKNLTSVTIGDSVTSIGDSAFFNCNSLTSVTIPDSVTSIGDSAFFNCDSLTSVTIPDSVTSIGVEAFSNCDSLTSVTILDSVTSIGDEAFFNCDSLTSVTIVDSVTSIGNSAFGSCDSLTSVTIGDSVKSIGDRAFAYCESLTSVTIGDSVTSIGSSAFEWCKSLTSVTIPDSVTSIGSSAFSGCSSLTSITLPFIGSMQDGTSNTHFGYIFGADSYSYNDNYVPASLKEVVITAPCKSIGDKAFYDCDSLTSVTILDSVISIGNSAFYNCPIKDVYYTGTRSQWKAIAIEVGNESLTYATIHYNTHKNIVDIPQQNPTCTKVGYTEGKQCSDCKEWISGHETIAKLGHSYSSSYTTDQKATLSANGSKSRHCTGDGCTAKTSVTAIARVSSFTLSTTNYVYDGKNKTPKVTVKDADGRQLVKNVDYKTSIASSRSSVGKHYVKVTLIGNYSGEKKVYFYIRPDAPKTIKATQSTSWIKLTWDKVNGAAGYSVYRYDTKTSTYKKLKATTATSYTDKNLYAGKKYIYKIVPYGRDADKNVYYSKSNIIIKTATKTKTPILSDYAVYKGKVKLFWTSTGGETGYQVWYSTKKDSGFKRYANYSSNTGYVNNLTSGKTYYFKVRTYIKTASGYVYSDWSNVKGIKIK